METQLRAFAAGHYRRCFILSYLRRFSKQEPPLFTAMCRCQQFVVFCFLSCCLCHKSNERQRL